jgi:hypothetical protein
MSCSSRSDKHCPIRCGCPDDNPSAQPMNVDDDATSGTSIPSDHCPDDNPSARPAPSPPIQSDDHCPDNNSSAHPAPLAPIKSDDHRPEDNPPALPLGAKNDAISCTCSQNHDHYRIRCGCANDKLPPHPMHINDDAFHHFWCGECLKYCYKEAVCDKPLPGTQIVRLSHYSGISKNAQRPVAKVYVLDIQAGHSTIFGKGMVTSLTDRVFRL